MSMERNPRPNIGHNIRENLIYGIIPWRLDKGKIGSYGYTGLFITLGFIKAVQDNSLFHIWTDAPVGTAAAIASVLCLVGSAGKTAYHEYMKPR